jgi:DNA-binding beta-propeller fold protein YncE
VDTASWPLLATVPTGTGSQGIIGNVTPDNAKLYVTNHGTHELIAIDTTYLLTGKLTPHGNGQLSVFDTLSGKLVGKKIPLGPGPTSVVVLP